MYCITSRIWDRPTRDCCTLSQRQNGYSVVPEHPHVGPHGPNRASFLMNPMYSIARTRQCPRKSCSPRQPMAAYMWNGLQPVTSFTLIPNPIPDPDKSGAAPCTNSDTPPRLSGSLLLSLTCCSPPSLLCGRNSGRLWGRSRGTTNIVIPQVILTFGLGQSNVNLLCVYVGMWNYFPPIQMTTQR